MLTIEEGRYFACMWFFSVHSPDREAFADVMGALWRDGEGPWRFDWRLRLYARSGGSANDDDDLKTWFSIESVAGVSEEQATSDCRKRLEQTRDKVILTGRVHKTWCSEIEMTEMRSDSAENNFAILMRQKNIHPVVTATGGIA